MAVLITAGMITSCTKNPAPETKNDGLKIVCSIFPVYDWVRNILGSTTSEVQLSLLIGSGVDLHSFQPTTDDIIGISESDVVIYVGGVSDKWIEDAVRTSQNEKPIEINLMEILDNNVKEHRHKESIEHDHEHGEKHEHVHEDEHGGEHAHEDGHHDDEHIWLSLKNAVKLTDYITEKLCEIDGGNADSYRENAGKYIDSLNELDGRYQKTVENAKHNTVIFGDRFPFIYLAEDYGLDYFAAFSGCSAETEASFETVAFLSDKLDELGLSFILTIERTNHNIAETIIMNTKRKDQKVLVMDSMQSVTLEDIEKGADYLEIMEDNLEVLKTALN